MSNSSAENCRLELILGPMFSGKSTTLMSKLRIKSIYKNVLAVNTVIDTRYSDEGICNHDGDKIDAIRVKYLSELLEKEEYKKAEVVGIDEGQFFPKIHEFIISELETSNKTFIVSALNGDKDKKLFGNIYYLLPHAESIKFNNSVCIRCGNGNSASFSSSLIKFEGQEKVGSTEIYEAVCRKHYDEIQQENIRNSK